MLIDVSGAPLAMAVDRVEGTMEVGPRDLRGAFGERDAAELGIRGVVQDGEGVVTVVDPSALFGPLLEVAS